MDGFKIRILHFAKAIIDELLDAAAAVFLDDAGAFANGVAVWNSILVFCDAHENASFSFSLTWKKGGGFMRQMARFVSYISGCKWNR